MTQAVRTARRAARRFVLGSTGARRYLAPGTDLEGFFAVLAERRVRYVVLRWFDDLPHVDPGEDVDLLVADEDLPVVHDLLRTRPLRPGAQPFDVYSVSGLPGSDFAQVPYYPPRFARQVLDGAVWRRGRYRVPSPQHHFESLAYHAVYHKGYASGLGDGPGPGGAPGRSDHDYGQVLGELAAELDTPVSPDLRALDEHLAARGLRPPLDTLERLEAVNPWIHDRFFLDHPPVDPGWAGVAVCGLRARAGHGGAGAEDELVRQGFEVVDVVHLDADQREAAAHRLRGGNWAQGPWPLSGGPPSVYLIAYDVAPRLDPPDDPRATNLRIPAAKECVRARLLAGVPAGQRYNPVHSSDNPRQALDYIDVLQDGQLEDRVRKLSAQLVEAFTWPYPVVRVLESPAARRSQVAVVDHPVHGHVVCKLFRPAAQRFFDREVLARTELGDVDGIPSLIESGRNWLLTRLYEDDLTHAVRRLPGTHEVQLRPQTARALARFALELHERGFFLLDLSSTNVISDATGGLRLADLEFLQRYAEPPPAPAACYTLRGLPGPLPHYDAPIPDGPLSDGTSNTAFHPAVTGLSVDDLLRPPAPGDAVRSAAVRAAWASAFLVRAGYRAARAGASRSRWGGRYRTVRTLVRSARRAPSA